MIKNKKNKYNQLVIWESTTLGKNTVKEFENFMLEQGFRVKFAEVVLTLPDKDNDGNIIKDTGNRSDLFFYINDDDISKFSIKRFKFGHMRWWEDVLGNINNDDNRTMIYSEEILKKYPTTWNY